MNVSKSSHTSGDGTKSPALPRWIEGGTLRTATLPEILLFALAGGKGERHRERPVVAIAERLAAKVNALQRLLGERIDDQDIADLLQETGEQADVLAVLVARGV